MNHLTLGKNQELALRALLEHMQYPGGWIWANHSSTVRMLEGLERKGLAQRTVGASGRPRWTPTDHGIAYGRHKWVGQHARGYLRTEWRAR